MKKNLKKINNRICSPFGSPMPISACLPSYVPLEFKPGTVTLVSGVRPSGKTSYLLHLLKENALKGVKSVFYPLRQTQEDVAYRLLSSVLDFPTHDTEIIDDLYDRLQACEGIDNIINGIVIGDGVHFTPEAVERELSSSDSTNAFSTEYKGDIRLVVIDDLHLLADAKDMVRSLEGLMLRLKKLAMEYKVAVVVSSLLVPRSDISDSQILEPSGYTTLFSPRLTVLADNLVVVFQPTELDVMEDEFGKSLRRSLMFYYSVEGYSGHKEMQIFHRETGHIVSDEEMLEKMESQEKSTGVDNKAETNDND